jgi:hypothetical protein
MDLALAWAIRLQGKTDQEKFKDLGWGLRTWDQWYFNECDDRFGDDWPVTRKPDLIFFDPPYYTKKQKAYEQNADKEMPSISSYSKKDYTRFFKNFFTLSHKHTKPGTILAFLNADWRNFESTPAIQEKTDNSVTLFDYHGLLSDTGWKTTHRIECPLSSERLTGNQVKRMQDKRILGTIGRILLITRRT